MIKNQKFYRVLIARNAMPLVNMVYAEIGDEILGAFSADGVGGLFHFNTMYEAEVSDDFRQFKTKLNNENLERYYIELEGLRAELEEFDDQGNMIGLSRSGLEFLNTAVADEGGYIEVYSEGASADFIYDIQDEWNLNFHLS